MIVIFDVDGVLIDSAHLIERSYKQAGVHPPDNILAQEGTHWLDEKVGATSAPEIHKRQNAVFLSMLRHPQIPLNFLPPWRVARRLGAEHEHLLGVMTGAPVGTLDALRMRARRHTSLIDVRDTWPFHILIEATKTPRKMHLLNQLGGGVYIDDQSRLVDTPPNWQFIHYTGQTEDELYDAIMERTWPE